MKIYLIRHAKTEQRSQSGKDFDRSLMPRGKRQAADLATHLKSTGVSVVKILCSDAQRTRETYSLLNLEEKAEFLLSLYLCTKEEMLRIINAQQVKGDLMLIGHNEGISDLASYLSGQYVHLQTGAMAVLDFQGDNWAELSGDSSQLINVYRSSTD